MKSQALPRLTNREKVVEMVDPVLQGQYSKKELIQVSLSHHINTITQTHNHTTPSNQQFNHTNLTHFSFTLLFFPLSQVAAIAAVCVQSEAEYRPLMTDVVQSLIPLVKSQKLSCPTTPSKLQHQIATPRS